MARVLSPEEMEDVRLTEIGEAQRRAARARTSVLQAGEGQLKLYHPSKDALKFGPGSETRDPEGSDNLIVFGQLEPGVAIIRADHPLLPALLRRHSGIQVLEAGEIPGRSYACELCDAEFPTKRGMQNHRKSAHPAPPEHRASPVRPAPAAKPRRAAPEPEDAITEQADTEDSSEG